MSLLNRRHFVKTLTMTSASCSAGLFTRTAGAAPNTVRWPYAALDAARAADAGYVGHRQMKSCMYGVFASIVKQLAAKLGEPYQSFPCEMMVYGEGGVAGWGSLCGSLNGGAAVISLLVRDTIERRALTDALFFWYQSTPLPMYVPPTSSVSVEIPAVDPQSILCHSSCSAWIKKAKVSFYSKEREERCTRLTADVARKTVELLNRSLSGSPCESAALDQKTRDCLSCHGKDGAQANVLAKSCHGCHFTAKSKHP